MSRDRSERCSGTVARRAFLRCGFAGPGSLSLAQLLRLGRDVLFVVAGEMSHTPKISRFDGQPGREHRSRAISLLLAGGGPRMGQVIGSTTTRGEEPKTRPISPTDLLAMWCRFLGVPLDLVFHDHAGRPVPLLPDGEPIAERL